MKVMKALAIATLAAFCSTSFAQYNQPVMNPLVSKAPAGEMNYSQCAPGTALNGIYFTHNMGQDLTWQESFAAICVATPSQNQFNLSPVVKYAALPSVTTQTAPPGGYMTGIGFFHNNGQDFTYQESVAAFGLQQSRPVSVGSNCHVVSSNRGPTQLSLTCGANNEVVTSLSFSHQSGQNYVYQETVSLTCCPMR